MRLIGRIGLFFLFLGGMLLVLFIGTDHAGQPQFSFCFAALICLGVGIAMVAREIKPAQPTERFRLLRQIRQKNLKENRKE
jgi:drug/metabolite transporter (DMT)-like permease